MSDQGGERRMRGTQTTRVVLTAAACLLWTAVFFPAVPGWTKTNYRMTAAESIKLGEEFGLVVGEVDEEVRDVLGLQRAEGVVVYEVIGGKPADLAGIKVRAVIKEIDKVEIRNLADFGRALKTAMAEGNFTVATYEPPDPDNQGMIGGINFHYVRTEQN